MKPPVMPFSSLDLLQLLSPLVQALLPLRLVFDLFLVMCVDVTETSSDGIKDLLELVGK